MKKANRRTDYILVKAHTNSVWDTCSFAVFRIDDNRLNQWRKRLELAQRFIEDSEFFANIYLENVEGYYTCSEECGEDDIVQNGEAWAFVETDIMEIIDLPTSESRLDTHQLVLDRNCHAHFRAFGTYTGEEFYTEEFCIKDILKRSCDDKRN